MNEEAIIKVKLCPPGKILNPETNRCINKWTSLYYSLVTKGVIEYEKDYKELVLNLEKGKHNQALSKSMEIAFMKKIKKYELLNKTLTDVETKEAFKKHCEDNVIPSINYVEKSIHISYFTRRYFIPIASKKKNLIQSLFSTDSVVFEYTKSSNIYLESTVSFKMNNMNQSFYNNVLNIHFDERDYSKSIIDSDWINSCNDYISNLSDIDRFTLYGYTFLGDKYVNSYLRNNLNTSDIIDDCKDKWYRREYIPLFFDFLLIHEPSSVKEYIKSDGCKIEFKKMYFKYVDKIAKLSSGELIILVSNFNKRLSSILKNAPPLRQPMTLYRGSSTNYIDKELHGKPFVHSGYISASVDNNVASRFRGSNCCLMVLTLLPGTRVLPMSGISRFNNEHEFLINTDSKLLIQKSDLLLNKSKTKICSSKLQRLRITKLIVM
jgi:hypothetical protein